MNELTRTWEWEESHEFRTKNVFSEYANQFNYIFYSRQKKNFSANFVLNWVSEQCTLAIV